MDAAAPSQPSPQTFSQIYDIVVIGGGINGAGIARDAAGQGLKVLLCEKDDLASATSSASSKMIHGGLRYLEHGEFRLVRKALKEREVLLRNAPHIVWPLRFVLPLDKGLRPAWMIRLGLFLYDNLAGRRRLGGSRGVNLATAPEGAPLQDRITKGFLYSDCWVDDARLVVLTCLDAAERGAEIYPRTPCRSARRNGNIWQISLGGARKRTVTARSLVNAAGPWVDDVQQDVIGRDTPDRLRLVKGSHIIVDRLYDGPQAYILQNTDNRVVFALPYQTGFTLIGTTDVPYDGDPAAAEISPAEIDYLCAAINRAFKTQISEADVRSSYAGVRPLFDDGDVNASAVTRDYSFDLDAPGDGAPLLSVYGGKITTYRQLAEHAMADLMPELGLENRSWTAEAPLPGGDIPDGDFEAFLTDLSAAYAFLPPAMARRLARQYGTRSHRLLDGVNDLAGLGRDLGHGLYEVEDQYLRHHEWAETEDDILWRRTKLGLAAH